MPGVEVTDRLLDYNNEIARVIAKQYPDKRILTLAYTVTQFPPERVLPEPNIRVLFCPYPPRANCQSHDLACEKNRQALEDFKGWIAKCPKNMYVYEYPNIQGCFYATKRNLDFYAANGIRGILFCFVGGTQFTFQDLHTFVFSRALWTPNADVEALIDEFMAAYYGKAAPFMRKYFNFLCMEVEERQVHIKVGGGSVSGLFTVEFVEKALQMLRQAEIAAAGDQASLYRVRKEKFVVLFEDINERNLVNEKMVVTKLEFAERLGDFVRIARAMKVRTSGEGVENDWLRRVAKLSTKVQPWYDDPLVSRLIGDPWTILESEQRQNIFQASIPGGWLLSLDGFYGGCGPEVYRHMCEPRQAVWFYGRKSSFAATETVLYIDQMPPGRSCLLIIGQDDDKPGMARIRITINGKEVFAGENGFSERGWSEREFLIPPDILKRGLNKICFRSLDESAAQKKWFMIAECKVVFK